MVNKTIKHMVIFCLKYEADSVLAEKFLADGEAILSAIPGVQNFEVLKQVSNKNDYDYGFSMEFCDNTAYENYNTHESHVDFVRTRWDVEVTKFLEIDFTKLS